MMLYEGRFEIEHEPFPASLLEILRPLLARVAPLIPHWCRSVRVVYSHDLDGAAADMVARYDYRHALLRIAPKFFDEPPATRLQMVVHEVCHIYHEPLWNSVVDFRARLLDFDPKAGDLLNEITRHAREQCVCDMTDGFLSLLLLGDVPV